jgi:dihydroxyacetone kinase-like predicted kinase
LAALRRAGVVDAGGRGLVVLLDALESVVLNRPDDSLVSTWERPSVATALSAPVHGADPKGPEFEVMFLLEAGDADIPNLREQLTALGDSVVVVGGEDLWNVHVHADEPGTVIEAAVAVGRPFRIQITSLRPETLDATLERDDVTGTAVTSSQRGVVAVVPGQALADLFESVGATALIGAPGDRPSLAAFLSAIERCQGQDVVLLPNDGDHLAAAETAAEHARAEGRRVAVIPTRAPVQGLSALAVHDIARRFDDDVVSMTSAAASTRHGAVTVAIREAMTSAGICRPGDVLGLIDDDIAVIGRDLTSVAAEVLDRMLSAGGELVTLVLGADEISERKVSVALLQHLRQARPEVEVVSYEGGQEHYPLLLGVE